MGVLDRRFSHTAIPTIEDQGAFNLAPRALRLSRLPSVAAILETVQLENQRRYGSFSCKSWISALQRDIRDYRPLPVRLYSHMPAMVYEYPARS